MREKITMETTNDKKRPAASPVQSERSKESKNDPSSPKPSWASVAGGKGDNAPPDGQEGVQGAPGRTRTESLASTTSTAMWKEVTEGPMRICLTVDILTRDGEPYRGTVTPKEALCNIFVKALGFEITDQHGMTQGFKGNPTVVFRLKTPINIDERLQGMSKFEYEKMIKQ